jgi:hypothetical protein
MVPKRISERKMRSAATDGKTDYPLGASMKIWTAKNRMQRFERSRGETE